MTVTRHGCLCLIAEGEGGGRMMSKPRSQVLRFAEDMEAQLQKHDDRDGWDRCSVMWLFGRLTEEKAELRRAMRRADVGGTGLGRIEKKKLEAIVREAADVGNFAMMIADACRAWIDA